MLHAILLGIFGYDSKIFVSMLGTDKAVLHQEIMGIAALYGTLFTHQSERNLPKTSTKGITDGKITAKEYQGVLLVIAVVLHSTAGRRALITTPRSKFKEAVVIKDWLLLVELHLQWEAYLSQPQLKATHVKRLDKKNRFIMNIMKSVANRSEGMGLKIMKYHAIVHLCSDILLFGVPSEVDTGSNEEHHKSSKAAAQQTQKNKDDFTWQTTQRLDEYQVIELAMAELAGKAPIWEYLDEYESDSEDSTSNMSVSDAADTSPNATNKGATDKDVEEHNQPVMLGPKICIFCDSNNEPCFRFLSRSKNADGTALEMSLIEFLLELQDKVADHMHEEYLPILTCHKRGGEIFRGHPNWMGKGPWRDWALLDWGDYGVLPVHIWCFVELNGIPSNPRIQHGEIYLADGTYAVVESSTYSDDEEEKKMSDIFIPIIKDVGHIDEDGSVTERVFYLADVEAIEGPLCVVPDVGGAPNHYFQVKPRSQWPKDFVAWLEDTHDKDDMEGLDN